MLDGNTVTAVLIIVLMLVVIFQGVKMVPQGFTQEVVNSSHPVHTEINPQRIPSPIPIKIFAQSGSFFNIVSLY